MSHASPKNAYHPHPHNFSKKLSHFLMQESCKFNGNINIILNPNKLAKNFLKKSSKFFSKQAFYSLLEGWNLMSASNF